MTNKIDFNHADLEKNKNKFKSLIEDVVTSIKMDGMPSLKLGTDIKIENNNYQTQSQTQSQFLLVDMLIESMRNELSDEQIKQIRELSEKGESKGNIINKIAEFGKNTASNILANLIVNDKFWKIIDAISRNS